MLTELSELSNKMRSNQPFQRRKHQTKLTEGKKKGRHQIGSRLVPLHEKSGCDERLTIQSTKQKKRDEAHAIRFILVLLTRREGKEGKKKKRNRLQWMLDFSNHFEGTDTRKRKR